MSSSEVLRWLPRRPDDARPFAVSVVSVRGRRVWLRVAGQLDLATTPRLTAMLQHHRDQDRVFAWLDVSAVTFLDCAGLGALAAAHDRHLAAHGALVLAGAGPSLTRLLWLTGLDEVLFTVAGPMAHFGASDPIPHEAVRIEQVQR